MAATPYLVSDQAHLLAPRFRIIKSDESDSATDYIYCKLCIRQHRYMYDQRVFDVYKPLRNHVRKVCVFESFEVLRYYAQCLQFKDPIPTDIQTPQEFILAGKGQEKQRFIAEWELEILAREVIISADLLGPCPDSFKQLKCFAGAANKLKALENEISGFLLEQKNVFLEVFRIAHRQFPWQSAEPNSRALSRYFRIYSFPALDEVVKQEIGLTTLELYRAFFVVFAQFLKGLRLVMPIPVTPDVELNNSHIEMFLSRFSRTFGELRELLVDEQQFDDNYAYHFSSLRAFPVIKMSVRGQEFYACPFPTLLFWRLTGGLYFELSHIKGFDNAYGNAFQNFVGDVIAAVNADAVLQVYPEEKFGKEHKKTVDWAIADASAAIFLECKTKRVPLSTKTQIDADSHFKRGVPYIDRHINADYVTLPVTAGRVREGFKKLRILAARSRCKILLEEVKDSCGAKPLQNPA